MNISLQLKSNIKEFRYFWSGFVFSLPLKSDPHSVHRRTRFCWSEFLSLLDRDPHENPKHLIPKIFLLDSQKLPGIWFQIHVVLTRILEVCLIGISTKRTKTRNILFRKYFFSFWFPKIVRDPVPNPCCDDPNFFQSPWSGSAWNEHFIRKFFLLILANCQGSVWEMRLTRGGPPTRRRRSRSWTTRSGRRWWRRRRSTTPRTARQSWKGRKRESSVSGTFIFILDCCPFNWMMKMWVLALIYPTRKN